MNGSLQTIALDEVRAAASKLDGWTLDESQHILEFTSSNGFVTLRHDDGVLWTSHSEAWQIEPLLAFAELLGARVRGDEFETYLSAETTFFHADDVQLREESEAESNLLISNNKRQDKLIRNVIVGCFVLLGALGFALGKWLEGK
jgi:hypothetical protein